MSIKLDFTFETDSTSEEYIYAVKEVLEELSVHVKAHSYGVGLDTISIHVRMLRVQKGFEGFFQLKKPKFVKNKGKEVASSIDKKNRFEYEILFKNITICKLINSDKPSTKELVGKEVIDSLSNLQKLPKSLSNFNADAFKNAVISFFKAEIM